MSIVWAVKGAHVFRREAHILRFLKDERCSVRIVEVRLFKTSRLSERVPMDTRRWNPGGDLIETAKRSQSTSPIAGPRMRRLSLATSFNPRASTRSPNAEPDAGPAAALDAPPNPVTLWPNHAARRIRARAGITPASSLPKIQPPVMRRRGDVSALIR